MNKDNLSKILSYALRHNPDRYGISLDEEGWASLSLLISSIKAIHTEFNSITLEDIYYVINSTSKKRHEINDLKIRALYGHSTSKIIRKIQEVPPNYLYHGTTPEVIELIKENGIRKMGRQYVHLFCEIIEAKRVAERKTLNPVVLKIKAREAYINGINFYLEGEVWLSENIPSEYIAF